MLQAATGKLFTNRENPRRQDLKGVIYTNLDLGAVDRLTSRIGTLINLDTSHTPAALGYEMTEYMEAADPEPGVLVSRSLAIGRLPNDDPLSRLSIYAHRWRHSRCRAYFEPRAGAWLDNLPSLIMENAMGNQAG